MTKKQELKDVKDITEELSTVDDKKEQESIIEDPNNEIEQEVSIKETEVEKECQRCLECKYFVAHRGIYRKNGYKTCEILKKEHKIIAFHANGTLSPFLMSETFVPDVFEICKYYDKKIDK